MRRVFRTYPSQRAVVSRLAFTQKAGVPLPSYSSLIEADALHLLKCSFVAALHRGTQAGSSHLTVGANDVHCAATLLGRVDGDCLPPTFASQSRGFALCHLGVSDWPPAGGHWSVQPCGAELRRMATLLPTATIDRLVCLLAKRAGIGRHTPGTYD